MGQSSAAVEVVIGRPARGVAVVIESGEPRNDPFERIRPELVGAAPAEVRREVVAASGLGVIGAVRDHAP